MRTSKLIIICILICIRATMFFQLWNIPLELIKSLNGLIFNAILIGMVLIN
jgi:hypothetical protein